MKNIDVFIKSEEDLFNKYNNTISNELLNYIINESRFINGDITINIKTSLNIKNIDQLIKKNLLFMYNSNNKLDKQYNIKQIVFFIFGFIFLFLSKQLNYEYLNDILVIAGWVILWEVINISLNIDMNTRINQKTIKKILNSKIVIIGDDNVKNN